MAMRFLFSLLGMLIFCGMSALPACAAANGSVSRIGIRKGRFVSLQTGKEFTPKGVNFCRLRKKTPSMIAHSTFDPKYYDAAKIAKMFADLEAHGLNTVRVFLDPVSPRVGLFESNKATRLSPAYMNNVYDFLRQAGRHGVYVVVGFSMWGPGSSWLQHGPASAPMVSSPNGLYCRPGAAETRAALLSEVVKAIKKHDSKLLPVVLAYEPQNELCYFTNAEPLSLTKGRFRYEGRTYDLSSDKQLQRLMDDVSIHWCNTSVRAVKAVDPRALVSINVFTYKAVGRNGPNGLRTDTTKDKRVPARPLALAKSQVSYLDIHLYPHGPNSMQPDLKSIEFDAVRLACRQRGKPLLMGEFGAFKHSYPSVEKACDAMVRHVKEARDSGFAGYMYWTYDCDEQPRIWNAKEADGKILKALARIGPAEHTVPRDDK